MPEQLCSKSIYLSTFIRQNRKGLNHLVDALLLSHILNHAIKSASQIVICLDGYGMSCLNVIMIEENRVGINSVVLRNIL